MFMMNKRFIYNSGTPRSSQTNDSDGEYVHAMHMHEGCQSLISGDKPVRSKNNLMCSEYTLLTGRSSLDSALTAVLASTAFSDQRWHLTVCVTPCQCCRLSAEWPAYCSVTLYWRSGVAHPTNGRAYATMLCPSVVCNVAIRSVLPKNCLKKQTRNGLRGIEWPRDR